MTKNCDFPEELFAQMTAYCQASDFPEANLRRAQLLGIESENTRIAPGAIVRLGENGRIGRNCFIGLYSYLNGDVVLEDNVIIGPHCSITSNTHVFEPSTQGFTASSKSAIFIGSGSWLCAGCSVTSGVSVGKGNLICANAVVTRNTRDFAIMAGLPAREVGHIDPKSGAYHWSGKS